MNTEIKNAIQAADSEAQYDESAKRLLAQKYVLAHILVRTVEEFQGMEIEKVVSLIEGDPYISKVPVASGLTNKDRNVEGKRIVGLNTEAGEKNEGLVRFDIIFYVRMQAEETQTASLMPEDRRKQIQQRLDEWCAAMGYKDGGVNLLSLSHAIHVSKDELTIYFDQSLKTTFRIWLSDIRFAAAKKMMIANPDYSNDIISSECGFTSRTHLYRIFKAREACTPTVWRERYLAGSHDSDASLS